MPHFEIMLYPSYTSEQREALCRRVVDAAKQELGVSEDVVSVAFQEVAPECWKERVYQPLIQSRDNLAKKPNYK